MLKRFIAISIAVITVFSASSFALAATPCDCGNSPIIVVSGVGACPSYVNYGTENQRSCFPPEVNVGKIVVSALVTVASSIVKNDFDVFADGVSDIVLSIFEDFTCDEYGNSVYEVTPTTYPLSMANYDDYLAENCSPELQIAHTAADIVGADHTYFYNYDWRLDPLANADSLDAFIKNVLKETNHNSVTLVPCSMGGVQTLAYLGKYGSSLVNKVIFMSSADSGLLFVGNLFSGEFQINQYDAFQYLKTLKTGNAGADKIISFLCDSFGSGNLFKGLFSAVNLLGDKLNEKAMESVLKKTFARMPGMWAFINDSKYGEAKELLIDDATDEFIEKIDSYHYDIQSNREEILESAREDTVIVYCSHYERGSIPITSAGNCQGDMVIETVGTSGGATCATEGTTFSSGYVQKEYCGGHNHVSADMIIDASTCTYPDYTWFFKGIQHVGCYYGSDQGEFIKWILSCKSQPTVFDNEKYPQFMQADAKQMTLTPVR